MHATGPSQIGRMHRTDRAAPPQLHNSKLIGAAAMPEIYGHRPFAALLAVHALRALSWAHGCVWGAAGGCRTPPQRVDIPNKARFTEERAKRALPGEAGKWQPRPVAPQTRTCAHDWVRRSYVPGDQAIGRWRSLS